MTPSEPRTPAAAAELFCRYRRTGDSRALTEVFDQTAPELLRLASHLSGGLVEAEDLVQHTFLVAIQKAKRFKADRPLLPWLAGILIREAQKQRRKRARAIDPDRLHTQEAAEGERIALDGELLAAVTGALGKLPAKYQGVLRPFLLEGRSAPEIAELTSSAPGTVRVQLHRGLDLLRRALPTGIGLGLVGAAMPRGLGNVRLAVEASASTVPIAAASTVTLAPLATAMTAKTAILGAALVAAVLCLTFIERDRVAPKTLQPEVKQAAAVVVETPSPLKSDQERESLATEVVHESALALTENPTPPAATPTANRALLRGTINAAQRLVPAEFELELRAGANHDRILLHTVEGSGAFELDLELLLADDDPTDLEMLVITRNDQFRTASAYAEFARIERGTAVYEVTLNPAFIEFTVCGRLVPVEGRTLRSPKVTMMIEKPETPPEYWTVELAAVTPDGEFKIRLPNRNPGTLYAWAENSGVSKVEIHPSLEREITLDPIQLTVGSTIRGVATRDGEPLQAGSTVFAMLQERPTPFTYSYSGMLLHQGDIAFQTRTGLVEEGGAFTVDGLEEEMEYSLVAVPLSSTLQYRKRFDAGSKIEAPAWNVALDWGLISVQILIREDDRPVEKAKAMLVPPKLDSSLGMDGIHGGEWLTPNVAGASGIIDVLIPTGVETEYEIEAPGYVTQRLTLNANALPKDRVLIVSLERGEASASLTLNVTSDGTPLADGTPILLTRVDSREGLEYFGPVLMKDGIAHFAELPPGIEQIYAAVSAAHTTPYEALPLVDRGNVNLAFEPLESGEARTESLELLSTGMIEVRVTGRDIARAAPAFELVAGGRTQTPQFVFATEFGNATSHEFQGDGPCALERGLVPGQYIVRLLEGEYEAEEREVEVRPGERLQLTFDLRVRY